MNKNQVLKCLEKTGEQLDMKNRDYLEHHKQTVSAIENAAAFYLGDDINMSEIHSLLFPGHELTMATVDHFNHLPFPQVFLYGSIATKQAGFSFHFGIVIQEKPELWKQRETPIHGMYSLNVTITPLMISFEYNGISVAREKTVLALPFVSIPTISESDGSLHARHLALSPVYRQYLEKESEYFEQAVMSEIITAYFLKLLSCKNIVVKEEYAGNENKKNRIPSLEYKTIHIRVPGNKYIYQNKEYDSIPFHEREKFGMTGQKRGHFKTYTEDKPLFGRHVGTWWWSPLFDTSRKRDYVIEKV